MIKVDTVLFDLDGTLLPMEQKEFIRAYFGELARRCAPLGYEREPLIAALWKGTSAMIANDGVVDNKARFWEVFLQELGERAQELDAELEDFYATDFNRVKQVVRAPQDVRGLLTTLRAKGYGVALASNPIFPAVALRARLAWVGLGAEDFDLATSYENSAYCKPNPKYFSEIFAQLGKRGEQCLMVGNNPRDDMAAAQVGAQVFLLTDYLENEQGLDISPYPHGDFAALVRLIEALP
ncbi:MAG: HAD family hydrolase [Christensenellaceae bacterium]|jgi:HAD superfamily hydrolase (TIGR01549 family)|nr:HAD family hydrolase [Christensenellaceae bacterium]